MEQNIDVENELVEQSVDIQKEAVWVNQPSGTIEITENGDYNVGEYAEASVNVAKPTATMTITNDGSYDVEDYKTVEVNVNYGDSATITENNSSLDTTHIPSVSVAIPAGGGGGPLDPQEVYRTERPAEWYPMPSVSDNEIYCLIEIPKPNQAKDPGVKIEFADGATAWKVEAGIVVDGSFVPNPDYTESYTGWNTYSATFYYNDFSSNPLSDGSHQVMLRIVATSGNFSGFSNPVGMDNIIETRLHVESISSIGSFFKGRKMKFFSMEGGNRITSFNNMFNGCSSLTAIPQLDTSSGTNFQGMFNNCFSLTAIPQLDTSSGTNFQGMFSGCYSLTAITQLNTSSGTNFGSMFNGCSSLTAIPQLDTSSGTNFSNMFSQCTHLRYVNFVGYDFTGITNTNNRPNNTSITRDGVARIDNKFQMSTGGFTGSIFSPSSLIASNPAYILVEDNGTMVPLGTSATTVFGSNQYLYVVVSDSMYNTYMADTNWSALGARLKKESEVTLPDWYTRV